MKYNGKQYAVISETFANGYILEDKETGQYFYKTGFTRPVNGKRESYLLPVICWDSYENVNKVNWIDRNGYNEDERVNCTKCLGWTVDKRNIDRVWVYTNTASKCPHNNESGQGLILFLLFCFLVLLAIWIATTAGDAGDFGDFIRGMFYGAVNIADIVSGY